MVRPRPTAAMLGLLEAECAVVKKGSPRIAASPAAPSRGGIALERAYLAGRPVGHERLADHPPLRHWPPLAAVGALSPVVAHHEVHPRGDPDLLRELTDVAAGIGADPGLVLPAPVDVHATGPDAEAVARKSHHALDEVGVRALRRGQGTWLALLVVVGGAAGVVVGPRRRLEDHDVVALGIAVPERHPVD